MIIKKDVKVTKNINYKICSYCCEEMEKFLREHDMVEVERTGIILYERTLYNKRNCLWYFNYCPFCGEKIEIG